MVPWVFVVSCILGAANVFGGVGGAVEEKFRKNITPVLSDCLSTDPVEFRMGTGQFAL